MNISKTLALATVFVGGVATHSNAATVRLIDFVATNFTSVIMENVTPNIPTVFGTLSVLIEDSPNIGVVRTNGVQVLDLNISIDSDIILARRILDTSVQIGGISPGESFGRTGIEDNDFFARFPNGPTGATTFVYSQADQPNAAFITNDVSYSIRELVAPIPLPASAGLFAVGLLSVFGLRRVKLASSEGARQ